MMDKKFTNLNKQDITQDWGITQDSSKANQNTFKNCSCQTRFYDTQRTPTPQRKKVGTKTWSF